MIQSWLISYCDLISAWKCQTTYHRMISFLTNFTLDFYLSAPPKPHRQGWQTILQLLMTQTLLLLHQYCWSQLVITPAPQLRCSFSTVALTGSSHLKNDNNAYSKTPTLCSGFSTLFSVLFVSKMHPEMLNILKFLMKEKQRDANLYMKNEHQLA